MKKRHTEEQILRILREGEQGKPLPELLREHGIASGTYYRWKSKYGGLEPSQLHRLRELERENTELKKMLAEEMLKNRVLSYVCEKKL